MKFLVCILILGFIGCASVSEKTIRYVDDDAYVIYNKVGSCDILKLKKSKENQAEFFVNCPRQP